MCVSSRAPTPKANLSAPDCVPNATPLITLDRMALARLHSSTPKSCCGRTDVSFKFLSSPLLLTHLKFIFGVMQKTSHMLTS